MSALLLAILMLGQTPAATPASPATTASPAPPASAEKREKADGTRPKRAPDRKKASPPKVLTNDDLEKTRQGSAAVSVLAGDGVEPAPVSSESQGSDVALSDQQGQAVSRDETTWRLRAQAARTRVTDTAAFVEQVEHRLAALRNNMVPEDPMNPFREQAREAAIKTETERLEAAKEKAAAARQAMDDLEEQARKANIPPGWLREP